MQADDEPSEKQVRPIATSHPSLCLHPSAPRACHTRRAHLRKAVCLLCCRRPLAAPVTGPPPLARCQVAAASPGAACVSGVAPVFFTALRGIHCCQTILVPVSCPSQLLPRCTPLDHLPGINGPATYDAAAPTHASAPPLNPEPYAQVRFVVMNNLLRTDVPLHRKFDLKGSTYGRSSGPDMPPSAVHKDLDVDMQLHLAPDWHRRYVQHSGVVTTTTRSSVAVTALSGFAYRHAAPPGARLAPPVLEFAGSSSTTACQFVRRLACESLGYSICSLLHSLATMPAGSRSSCGRTARCWRRCG